MSSSLTRLKRGRAIHLLDPENLCGSSLLTEAMVAEMRGLYTSAVSVGPQDHIILASAHCSLLPMADGWPDARYQVRSGKDGADICLANIMLDENVADRFDHVFVASGDGGLAPFVADIARRGARVTVVSRRAAISARMRLAATDVIYIDSPAMAFAIAA
ncbi:hypothetical protein GY21_08820 [Cryobacterium roopkundense]|uniref:Uncharacterized LabA/DUF88 family protein n=1 Tax=Cryobacterium roopkundense TaxID=1001240 RepID=A0A099JHG0_9MICO|nr:NYN domain-containing protein [Cryobacterium roopkundense]KGJ76933.1 hypothetical protein GY21_08820 [Cryobacterium roopkundense]MBB5643174.1 uncharacterized LabA/DUF88 family protein [Cryobacterium roopkundense]